MSMVFSSLLIVDDILKGREYRERWKHKFNGVREGLQCRTHNMYSVLFAIITF